MQKVLFDRCFLVSLLEFGSMASLARPSDSTDTCEDCFSFKATGRDLQLDGSAELFGTFFFLYLLHVKFMHRLFFSFGMLVASGRILGIAHLRTILRILKIYEIL